LNCNNDILFTCPFLHVKGVPANDILNREKVDNEEPTEPLYCVLVNIALVVDNTPAIYIIYDYI